MKTFFGKIISVLAIVGLVGASLPVNVMAKEGGASTDEYRWGEHIDELLQGEYVDGEVIVGIDNSKKSLTFARLFGGKELSDTGDEIVTVAEDSLDISEGERNDKDISIEVIRRDDMSTREIMEALRGDSAVVFAEPNYLTETTKIDYGDYSKAQLMGLVGGDDTADKTSLQWGNMSEGYGMHVPNWNQTSNMDHEVIVAVMDSGVDNTHEDLRNKIYHISPELQALTGCSELRRDNINNGELNPHGTHVAGIIGAEWNDVGVSGVASNVKIIDVRNGDTEGKISTLASIKGYSQIKTLMKNNVKVKAINNSWGSAQGSLAINGLVNEVGRLGAVSLFAAGNDGFNIDTTFRWPASTLYENPYVVIVGSSTKNGDRSSFSNYSDTIVDVYAPGSDIMSTIVSQSKYGLFDSLTPEGSDYLNSFESEADLTGIRFTQTKQDDSTKEITPVLSSDGGRIYDGAGNHSMVVKVEEGSYKLNDGGLYGYPVLMELGDLSDGGNRSGQKMLGVYLATDHAEALTVDETRDTYNIKVKKVGSVEMEIATAINCDETSAGSAWGYCYYILPDDTDYEHFTAKLILTSTKVEDTTFYIDGLGIGEVTPKVSYSYMSGTSMATPGATGALAVLLGRVDENEQPTADVAKTMLLSHVRKISHETFPSKTGGIIDLSVNNDALAPVITDTNVSSNKIVVDGENFVAGSTVVLTEAGPYEDGENYDVTDNAEISSGRITINFDGAVPKGVYYVTVTAPANRGGQSARRMVYAGKTDRVYEKDLAMIDDAEDNTDANTFWNSELNGFVVDTDNYLYLMPGKQPGLAASIKNLYRYDYAADNWEQMASLPEEMFASQGAAIDGKIVVLGAGETSTKGYIYDIAENRWDGLDMSNLGVPNIIATGLVNYNGKLVVVGPMSMQEAGASGKMYVYDYKTGTMEPFGDLEVPVLRPILEVHQGSLYVLGPVDNSGAYFPVLQRVNADGSTEVIHGAFDELANDAYFSQKAKAAVLVQLAMDMASVDDKLMLVGPGDITAGTDTYVFDGEKFVPYERRVSDSLASNLLAVGHDGKIYAMGFAPMEDGRMIFRASMVRAEDPNDDGVEDTETEGDDTKTAGATSPNTGAGGSDVAKMIGGGVATGGVIVAMVATIAIAVVALRRLVMKRGAMRQVTTGRDEK